MSDVLDVPKSNWRQDEEIQIFSDAVSGFFDKELKPNVEDWREAGMVPRDVWYQAGEMGLLLPSAPEQYGLTSFITALRSKRNACFQNSPLASLSALLP